jgi:hypothetical protein
VKSLYAACLSRLGLSQTEAARLHDVDVSTIKQWSSGRRSPPPGIWGELQGHEAQIVDGSEELRERWERAGSPPIEINDSEADGVALMAAADFVLSSDAAVHVGQTAAVSLARQARRPN